MPYWYWYHYTVKVSKVHYSSMKVRYKLINLLSKSKCTLVQFEKTPRNRTISASFFRSEHLSITQRQFKQASAGRPEFPNSLFPSWDSCFVSQKFAHQPRRPKTRTSAATKERKRELRPEEPWFQRRLSKIHRRVPALLFCTHLKFESCLIIFIGQNFEKILKILKSGLKRAAFYKVIFLSEWVFHKWRNLIFRNELIFRRHVTSIPPLA